MAAICSEVQHARIRHAPNKIHVAPKASRSLCHSSVAISNSLIPNDRDLNPKQDIERYSNQSFSRAMLYSRERGCQMIAKQSDRVVPIDQPEVILDAIRSVVDVASGRNDVPLCGSRGDDRDTNSR
jgi:hypothetical protein